VRVLVVDDETTILRALGIALGRAGYDVKTAETGESARALLQAEHFDAMIVDLRIPDMRGDVLFELAASLQPHLRTHTLFTTGDASDRAIELIEACQCPVLPKPFDLGEMLSMLARMVRPAKDQTA
jgi:DNA-binding NtrC family response regulator